MFMNSVLKTKKRIQGKLREIGTYDIFKISLSCFDDKRHCLMILPKE